MFSRFSVTRKSAAEIHAAIAREVEAGVYDKGIFKAIFLSGGPGSGKSFAFKRIAGHLHMKILNVDDAWELLLKTNGIPMRYDDQTPRQFEQGQNLRDDAWRVTDNIEAGYLLGRLPIVFDGTGANVDTVGRVKKKMEALGYSTAMLLVNTELPIALERNRERKRSLPEDLAIRLWNEVQSNIGKFQSMFMSGSGHMPDGFRIIDNNMDVDKDDPLSAVEMQVYKWVIKIRDAKITNPVALKWIEDEMAARKR